MPADAETPLGAVLRELIATEGPISVERYMALALAHPVHGYYRTRDPLGAAGDFTTAPEISQMFGELIGLWMAETWAALGRPGALDVVELGPGRGTLMADALRAAAVLPGFLPAASLHLVETSGPLRAAQAERLAPYRPTWHDRLDTLPAGPSLVVANEFLDALPIRQFVRSGRGWHERLVGLDGAGGLAFGLAAEPAAIGAGPPPDGTSPAGTILEVSPAILDVATWLGRRLNEGGGAALLIDYGHAASAPGDTLQAVRRHAFVHPLATPGEADLTAHVDFAAFRRAAASAGAHVHGPVEQGVFLGRLGLQQRAERLTRSANPAQAEAVEAAVARLAGREAGQMGALFKVLGLSGPGLPALAGFA